MPILLVATFLLFYIFLSSKPLNNQIDNVKIDIVHGYSVDDIANIMIDNQIIYNKWLLKIFSSLFGINNYYSTGYFIFDTNFTVYNMIYNIINKITTLIIIQIPEGLSNYQVIDKIIKEKNYNGVINDLEQIPEDYLFPNTYYFEKYSKMSAIINKMYNEGQKTIQKLIYNKKFPPKINNIEKLLILASIVEKEKGPKDDPRMIAGVFINRLKINMRLDADPTLIFALTDGTNIINRKITNRDKLYKHPCNTYYRYGLPAKMISNPSKESIDSVLNYINHDYYYFVTNGQGSHNFSKTIKEQNINIKKWKQNKINNI